MITAAAVIERIGTFELGNILAGRIEGDINTLALVALVENADTSSFTSEELTVSQAAQDRLVLAIDAATRLINGYVAKRHPAGLSPSQIANSPLPDIALVLVKYELMVTTDEDTRNNHKAAMAQLRDISSGALSLGADDPAKPSDARIVVGGGYSNFDWSGFGK